MLNLLNFLDPDGPQSPLKSSHLDCDRTLVAHSVYLLIHSTSDIEIENKKEVKIIWKAMKKRQKLSKYSI